MKDKEETPTDSNQGSMPAAGQSDRSQAHDIPPEGSLGLLALGAVGITEWRYARERARQRTEAPPVIPNEERDPSSDEDATPGDPDQQPPVEDE